MGLACFPRAQGRGRAWSCFSSQLFKCHAFPWKARSRGFSTSVWPDQNLIFTPDLLFPQLAHHLPPVQTKIVGLILTLSFPLQLPSNQSASASSSPQSPSQLVPLRQLCSCPNPAFLPVPPGLSRGP